jgi:hypothetical protein
MEQGKRGATLTVFAILFAILAVSNLAKPFQIEGPQTGFVFFGTRLAGTWNDVVGPLFGIFLLVYAAGIWRMKRYALPMGCAYAVYVILNLTLYSVKHRGADNRPGFGFMLVYIAVAIGVSTGTALILFRRRGDLTT